MKKNYEEAEIQIISLNCDVVTASIPNGTSILDFDFVEDEN